MHACFQDAKEPRNSDNAFGQMAWGRFFGDLEPGRSWFWIVVSFLGAKRRVSDFSGNNHLGYRGTTRRVRERKREREREKIERDEV